MFEWPAKEDDPDSGGDILVDHPHAEDGDKEENQFVLRLPSEPSLALREAIKSGTSNLKERLFIQLEPDKSNNTQ